MAVEYRTDPEYFERLDGVAYPKVSPRTIHAWVQAALLMLLRTQGRGFGKVGGEWKFRVGRVDGTDSWLLPDVAFVTNERLRPLAGEDHEEPPFAPDIAVEVRSPSERRGLRERKIERYLATGSLLVLDVDPQARAIRAVDAAGEHSYAEGDRVTHAAFPWLAVDIREVFADLEREGSAILDMTKWSKYNLVMKVTSGQEQRSAGIGEAKAHFSRLVREAAQGREWIITERGRPVARLVPMAAERATLDERLRMLERSGIIEPPVSPMILPPPLPLEPGLAQRFLNDDRGTR